MTGLVAMVVERISTGYSVIVIPIYDTSLYNGFFLETQPIV